MKFDFDNAYDGERLTRMARASVHANGRLNFPTDAVKQLSLELGKSLLITPADEKDLAVVVLDKDEDKRGFEVKKSGPYFYVPFKTLLKELGIDFVNDTVVYDIIEKTDTYRGKKVFLFNRRIIKHGEASTGDEATTGGEDGEES